MPEFLLLPAFTLWGSPVTWLELVAVVLSLAMVGFNIREIHWGWPLAIVASVERSDSAAHDTPITATISPRWTTSPP